ncbi:mechanosensitive ion channel [Flavobacteriaceae bacterium F89]|uniref:Mechanosensitive ion channel n=1 Tax=Cerina litoralis TaxID=2874477 RepID=A0AAE3EQW8_9FLAO|nr:mechanosensitive ion channel domain-containing protein [Cerina litoralis]MCG2459500.1 mechanosensitive ion channel [Cerina litoralis]
MEALKKILDLELLSLNDYTIRISDLVTVLVILFAARILLLLIKKALFRKHKLNHIDAGNIYALYQIIKYVTWVMAISMVLETIGISVTFLLAGSAALLVGVGLGLQQTFNDVISGIILLSERSVRIDDVLEIDNEVVKIQSIGLRTSKAHNRDDISIIVPNSLITTSKVINWSHQTDKARFSIDARAGYGSNIDLVIKILEESALEHPEVSNRRLVEARLINFGTSFLDFQLLFFSANIFRIERVKSDIRRIINKKFIKNQILMPYPQLDLHVRSNPGEKREEKG